MSGSSSLPPSGLILLGPLKKACRRAPRALSCFIRRSLDLLFWNQTCSEPESPGHSYQQIPSILKMNWAAAGTDLCPVVSILLQQALCVTIHCLIVQFRLITITTRLSLCGILYKTIREAGRFDWFESWSFYGLSLIFTFKLTESVCRVISTRPSRKFFKAIDLKLENSFKCLLFKR